MSVPSSTGMSRALTVGVPASCPAAPTYQPRQPEHTVLYPTIESRLPTFLAHTAGDVETPGLPSLVKREFEA